MKWPTLVLAVSALALVAGCGNDDSPQASPTTTADGPLVTYSREGGVASMPIELTIEPDGKATLVSEYDGQRESFDLSETELAALESELEAANLDEYEAPTEPSTCADCFVYRVEYGGTTITYDDIATPPDEIVALVGHLDELAMAHTPAPAQ
jgi:hypothetical protein